MTKGFSLKLQFLIQGFINGSLKTKNIYDEEQNINTDQRMPRLPNGDYFLLRRNDGENLIEIDYAIRSDINQLQSIEFDIIFSKQINRMMFSNYLQVNNINQTGATTITSDVVEDISISLEYEVDDSLGYTELKDIISFLLISK